MLPSVSSTASPISEVEGKRAVAQSAAVTVELAMHAVAASVGGQYCHSPLMLSNEVESERDCSCCCSCGMLTRSRERFLETKAMTITIINATEIMFLDAV